MKLDELHFLPEGWELIKETIITEGKKRKKAKSTFEILQKNKIPLTPEERKTCMDRDCVWNFHHFGGV